MTQISTVKERSAVSALSAPSGLHHFNYFTHDLEACRHFYEDIAGIPLVGFWIESVPDSVLNAVPRADGEATNVMGHAFFGLGDGSVMAFMQFADADLHEKLIGNPPPSLAHIALNVNDEQFAAVRERLVNEGYESSLLEVDHGVAQSIYVRDPNGLQVEFTLDVPGQRETYFAQGAAAHEYFKRYMAGDRVANSPAKG